MKNEEQGKERDIPAEWRSGRDGMFIKFADELSAWPETGQEPSTADRGTRFYLDLQEKRLKRHGLELRHKLELYDLPVGHIDTPLGNVINPYEKNTHYCDCHYSKTLLREGKKVFHQKRDTVLYETITEPTAESWAKGDMLYCCPNCAAVSTIRELSNTGCRYCKTHFLASELYPKVTNYYQVDSFDTEKLKSRAKRISALFAAAGFVYAILRGAESVIGLIFTTLLTAAGGALFGYVVFTIGLLVWVIFNAVRSAPLLGSYRGSGGSRKKLTRRLQKFDPSFTYDYIAGKAASLYGTIAFSEDPGNLSQFAGTRPKRYEDLVDSSYRGGVRINRVGNEGKDLAVELELYLTSIYDRPGRLRAKNERVRMRLTHRADRLLNADFNIHAVRCPGCGVGFDAVSLRRCPYCGTDYRVEWEDWAVTDIS